MSNNRWPNLWRTDPFDLQMRSLLQSWPAAGSEALPPQIKVDVQEVDGEYRVTAELPGAKKEDIDVRIDGRMVSLSAEVRREISEGPTERNGQRLLRSERSYGLATRSFTLADDIDEARAQASYEDGILEMTLPKKASSGAHRVSVG